MGSKVGKKVSRRYAKALFDLCEPDSLEGANQALAALAQTWSESPELRDALKNPAYRLKERVEAIQTIASKVSASLNDASRNSLLNFLALCVENGRISALPEIAAEFNDNLNRLKKLLALEVTSAFQLPDGERTGIGEKLQKDFGSLVTLKWQVDPNVIGGLLIRSGDELLDGTVRGSIERMRGIINQSWR